MEFNKFVNIKDGFIKENMLLKTVIGIEAILIVVLTYTVISKTDSQKTVFLPPQNTYKEFWVSGDQVSQSYLETVGTFIAYNLLNVTKDNANQLISNILPMIESSNYYEVKKELQKTHNYIVSNQLSRSFFSSGVRVDPEVPNRMIVEGILNDSISTKIIKNRKVKLFIDYEIKFGLFKIINLSLKED